MRALILIAALAGAAPAAAQDFRALSQAADAQAVAQAEADRRREIDLTNQLSVLDAQRRSDQALRDSQVGGLQPSLPAANPKAPPVATPAYVQIPDGALTDSNARVRAASENRR